MATRRIGETEYSPRGETFYDLVASSYELNDSESELLHECCRILTELERLEQALDLAGVVVEGSTGQVRINPAVGELRQHRLALARVLPLLQLPDEKGDVLPTPQFIQRSNASRKRWVNDGTA